MTTESESAAAFDRTTARLIQREALRRAALELSTTTPAGLESVLARISAEVTAAATTARPPDPGTQAPSAPGTQAASQGPGKLLDATEPPPPHLPPL